MKGWIGRALPVGAFAVIVLAAGASAVTPDQAAATARLWLPVAWRGARVADVPRPTAVRPTAAPGPSPAATLTPPPASPTPTALASPAASPSPAPTSVERDCGNIRSFDEDLRPLAEVYVAPGGDDAAGDGSAGRPFASLRRAAQAARPGTAIRLQPGDYPGGHYLENLRGTADAPIWLGGVPGLPNDARPVFVGGAEAIHLTRVAYLVVHDLVVRGASANGINVDDGGDYANPLAAHHLVFRNVDISQVGAGGNQDCLKLSGLYDFQVLHGEFSACGGGGSAIDMVGAHRGLIARNRFADLGSNAVQAKGGSTDVEVRWNNMENAGARAVNMGGSTGFEFFRPPLTVAGSHAEARDVRVLANVIVGSQAPVAFVGCVDCLAANNTIVDPDRWVLRILQETTTGGGFTFEPARNGRFVNNLVYFTRGRLSTTVNVGPNTAAESFTFAHNLWFAHDDPARSRPDLPVPETGAVIGRDPLLDPNYGIPANSPAARAGVAVPGLRGDIAGFCYGDPPSIGAWEAE